MARKRRSKLIKEDDDEPSDERFSSQTNSTPIKPVKPKDYVGAFLSENWKQQEMVKRNSSYFAFTSLMHFMQLVGVCGLSIFAAREGGGYIAPAIAAGAYTVATINNSFDRNLHGLIGFLDSPIMIMMVCLVLMQGMVTGPAIMMSMAAYSFCTMPFFADLLISIRQAFAKLSDDEQSSCTVEEISANEENFINMSGHDPVRDQDQQENMVDASSRLIPDAVQQVTPLNNLLTNNWRENAVATTNTTERQVVSFFMIIAYLCFGGMLVEANHDVPLGAVTLAYGASSLLGYFGMGTQPIAKLMRVNMISVICSILGVSAILTSGMDLVIMALIALHLFDSFQGATTTPQLQSDRDAFQQNVNSEQQRSLQRQNDGPITCFLTESWKVNSFSKKNYATSQVVQILLMGAQLYTVLISMISGGPMALLSMILAMIMAGAFSFFSPMQITAVDAAQSNGMQLALLGGATHHIVTAAPGISFYVLFCLLAADTMMSCTTFFEEHSRHMAQSAGHAVGLLEKDGPNPGSRHGNGGRGPEGGDFNRQL